MDHLASVWNHAGDPHSPDVVNSFLGSQTASDDALGPQLFSTLPCGVLREDTQTVSAVQLALKQALHLGIILSQEWRVAMFLRSTAVRLCGNSSFWVLKCERNNKWVSLDVRNWLPGPSRCSSQAGCLCVTHSEGTSDFLAGVCFLLLYQENCYLYIKWFPVQKATPEIKKLKKKGAFKKQLLPDVRLSYLFIHQISFLFLPCTHQC